MNAKSEIAKAYNLLAKTSDKDYIGFDDKFKVDARIEETLKGKSTLTKFYVEDGSNISDHIITDALSITITGEVADIVYQPNLLLSGYIQARETLGSINVYLPTRTVGQISQIDKIVNTASNTIRKVEDIADKIQKIGAYGDDVLDIEGLKEYTDFGINKIEKNQTKFFKFIMDYYTNKKPMKIDTQKFGRLENMVLVGFSLPSNEDSYMRYTLDFQEVRKVKTIITPVKQIAKNVAGTQMGIQTQDKQDKGVVQGQEKSLLSTLLGG